MIEYSNRQVVELIDDRIHSMRDRRILVDRLVHGFTYEQIAEAHDLSVSQIKRIIKKGQEKIF